MTVATKRTTLLFGAAAAIAAIAVYLNSLANGFALDDNYIILTNFRVVQPQTLGDIWLAPYWNIAGSVLGLYRPGIISLYALEWMVSGGAPVFFHAVNILLHAAATVLVFLLIQRFTAAVPAFIGALVFAVHPIHTEAVANVVGQAEIVAALGVLGACLVHTGRPEGIAVSWGRRIATVLLFALALTTKESAVVLPGLLVACDFAQRRVRLNLRGLAEYADAMLMPLLLLAATLALYLIFRFEALGGTLIGTNAAPSLPYLREEYRVLNALRAFPEFLRLLFWPLDLAVDYAPAAILPVDSVRPMVVLGAALIVGLTTLALLTPWIPLVGLPAAWFMITIVTVSNLFFPIGVVIAERTLYLPSVAVSLAIAFVWQSAAHRVSPAVRRVAVIATALILLALGIRTWIRNPVWESTDSVWTSMVYDSPESYRTQWNLAVGAWENDRPEEAEARFRLAIRLYPRDTQLLAEYGNFLVSRGRFEEALPLVEQAYETFPWITRHGVILTHTYLALGRYSDAVRVATQTRNAGARPDIALAARAFAHQQMGDLDHAVAAWRVAVHYADSSMWRLAGYLARAEAAAGLDSAAIATIDTARPFAADSAGQRALDSVVAAIRSGCYREAARELDAGPLPPDRPLGNSCDELGYWYDFVLARQSASSLQNATPSRAGGLPTAGVGSR